MSNKLDVSNLDIDENGLNGLLAEIWEKGEEQPEAIVIKRSQIGKVIPKESYYTLEEDATSVDIVKTIGITIAQARELKRNYQVERRVVHVKDIQNPTYYQSDYGEHKLEIIE